MWLDKEWLVGHRPREGFSRGLAGGRRLFAPRHGDGKLDDDVVRNLGEA